MPKDRYADQPAARHMVTPVTPGKRNSGGGITDQTSTAATFPERQAERQRRLRKQKFIAGSVFTLAVVAAVSLLILLVVT
ncbi:hypothetical protein [Arthrobacter roseus]|uniref:hypothetical protein n=1 Tax=Arthrobacter roseus TaxID=136274 RepID=UPI0019666558|nr:hypothetical protein [Arthrobacter roseus]MBM7848884.1 hypothetical protein [Arthrobacter roseus]